MNQFRIGDGTGPAGFLAYCAHELPAGGHGVKCTFRACGHTGTIGHPGSMSCQPGCPCPCCLALHGIRTHGVVIGGER